MSQRTIVEEDRQQRRPKQQVKMSEKLSKCIIEARCTDNILFSCAATVGTIVLILQTLPVVMNNWVFLTEPRPINKTNENGEQMESSFNYNVGYFQICRMHKENNSGIIYEDYELSRVEREYKCYLNPLLSREDLSDYSVASLAVIIRLGLPALLHITGAFICSLAFILGVAGHLRKTCSTLISSISYICGSIILSTAVLMVVCVVDDELAPRMRLNTAGEPRKFNYIYGLPFFCVALSFLPVQICACLQAFLYFRRFPSVVEKLKYVPGLESKLRHAQLDKELGIPPVESWRRGSLANCFPFSHGITSRRNSRRNSQISFTNPNLLFVQEV